MLLRLPALSENAHLAGPSVPLWHRTKRKKTTKQTPKSDSPKTTWPLTEHNVAFSLRFACGTKWNSGPEKQKNPGWLKHFPWIHVAINEFYSLHKLSGAEFFFLTVQPSLWPTPASLVTKLRLRPLVRDVCVCVKESDSHSTLYKTSGEEILNKPPVP